jgi:hypothetical protein
MEGSMTEMMHSDMQKTMNESLPKEAGFHAVAERDTTIVKDTEKPSRNNLFPPYLLHGEWGTH